MTVAILIGITVWNGLSPFSSALEINMLVVGTSVNDVNVNTLTSDFVVEILAICSKV